MPRVATNGYLASLDAQQHPYRDERIREFW